MEPYVIFNRQIQKLIIILTLFRLRIKLIEEKPKIM